MLTVGITGGMACGKTAIMRMFAKRGAYVISADEIAHALMSPGQLVHDAVVSRFGRGVLNPDGTINRAALASAAFPERIKELNAIVHPAVIEYQDHWMRDICERDCNAIAMVEAALIFEAGVETHFDKLITVTCSEEQKIARFAERQQLTHEAAATEVRLRMSAQLSDSEKVSRSDYVIDNSGSLEAAEAQVNLIWKKIARLAEAKPSEQWRV